MADVVDISETIARPIVEAMTRTAGLDDDARMKAIIAALSNALDEADFFILHKDTIARLNEAALLAQAIIRMQGEELLRLAVDGAEVNPDFLGECETVQ